MSRSIVEEFASTEVWRDELALVTIDSEADSTLSSLIKELVDEYARSESTIEHDFSRYLSDLRYVETPTSLFKEIYLTELYTALFRLVRYTTEVGTRQCRVPTAIEEQSGCTS